MFRHAAPAAIACAVLLSACSPSDKPPEVPATPPSAEPAAPPEPTAAPEPAPTMTAMPGQLVKNDDKAESLASYEVTPSDCTALGRKFGELGRDEMLATLSPKVSEKVRAATTAKVEEAMSKRADAWIATCMSTLLNKAVEHRAIDCALAAKTFKTFDVCLNGEGGTPQGPAQKPGKGKKK